MLSLTVVVNYLLEKIMTIKFQMKIVICQIVKNQVLSGSIELLDSNCLLIRTKLKISWILKIKIQTLIIIRITNN